MAEATRTLMRQEEPQEDSRPSEVSEVSGADSDEERLESLKAGPKDYSDLVGDTWSMGIICIVKDLGDILGGTGHATSWFRLVFAFTALIVNVVIQFALLNLVWNYVE